MIVLVPSNHAGGIGFGYAYANRIGFYGSGAISRLDSDLIGACFGET